MYSGHAVRRKKSRLLPCPVVDPLRLIAWSDYLCPWCYNGSVRLRRIEEQFAGRVELEFRSYLLRPRPGTRDLERFRTYTESWRRPAAEEDAGSFRVWQGDEGPPSHSIPPQLVAKAARTLGDPPFRAVHERLLHAYFAENRDISADDTLLQIWRDAGLPDAAFERREDPALLKQVIDDHRGAIECGVTGVPSVMLEGQGIPLTGAQPIALYQRWIERTLAAG